MEEDSAYPVSDPACGAEFTLVPGTGAVFGGGHPAKTEWERGIACAVDTSQG
jgi:hypothetical protein